MSVLARNNVRVVGPDDAPPIVFVHGFGCDQGMWRHVAPAFEDRYRVVLVDNVGAGGSDASAYDPIRHGTLAGYAEDLVEVCAALDLRDATFVGHSVASMMGVLTSIAAPERIGRLVLVAPSPRFVNDGDYAGGFEEADIRELLEQMDHNYLGWAQQLAPVIMGVPEQPQLADELTASFCRVDPVIARQFARVTFLSDNRADLAKVSVPTLVLQCSDDALAPVSVGSYVHTHIADSTLVVMQATGHCPNLSAPRETVAAIAAFLAA